MRFIILPLVLLICACQPADKPTAYQTEIAEIENKIAALREDLEITPDRHKAAELVYRLYQRSSLSGSFSDFKAVDSAIDKTLNIYGPSQELLLFQANLDFKLHRLAEAKAVLGALPSASHPQVAVLQADLAFQEGRYQEALAGYKQLIENNRSWDNLARLAYYKAKTGHPADADRLYEEAGEMVSVKEMRAFAWLELQRGLLDLDYRRYKEALAHYTLADRAYSGYWLIEEHLAEALYLTGETDAAIALYRKVIDKTQNPEFISALASILYASDPETANTLYQQADELFARRYQLYPNAALGHFIEYMLGREQPDQRLLSFARRNHEIRPNAKAKFLLVRSFQKMQRPTEARELMQEILKTPWRTPDIKIAANKMGLL